MSIACVVLGAAIAAIALFFFWGGKRGRRARAATDLRLVPTPSRQRSQPNPFDPDKLPQETAHEDLKRDFSGLETSIKNWSLDFFHNRPLPPSSLDDQAIDSLLDEACDKRFAALSTRLSKPRDRNILLKSFLAKVLLSRVDPSGNSESSLLPGHMVCCYQDLAIQHTKDSVSPRKTMTALMIRTNFCQITQC